jgi:putative ABC transport system permease protein
MLQNHFKVALRNLIRSKGFSLVNILGLAIGMASALIILLWVQNEWGFDRYYPNQDRLYTVWNKDMWGDKMTCWPTTPKVMGTVLKTEYPEIEQSARVNWPQTLLVSVGEKHLNISGTMVDSNFLTMFSVPFLTGNAASAFSSPYSILLTRSMAKQLFGSEDPMGKIFKLDNQHNVTVTGVIEDWPNNSRFNYKFLLPWSYMKVTGQDDSFWGNNSTTNYVLVRSHTNIAALNQKFSTITMRHSDPKNTGRQFLYPVNREHLYGHFKDGKPDGGRIDTVRVFFILAIFILLIACINFMNLSTARSEKRAKEVGIRKTIGARKESLVTQFLMESLLISMVAGIIALLAVQLCLPSFNELTQKHLYVAYGSLLFWLFFGAFILLTGVLAGSYPAFFLASFKPVKVLKGAFKGVNALVTPRKALVVLQFTFAIALIISTVIIVQQLRYAQNRESGYDRNQVLYVSMQGDIRKNANLIKNELLGRGIATAVSNTSSPLTQSWSNGGMNWPGKAPDDKTIVNRFSTDGNLVKTFGIQVTQGREIDLQQYPTDTFAVLLNESAVKAMRLKNPIGQIITDDTNYHVIGVIKDFIIESPYEPIRPMALLGPNEGYNVMHVRLNPAHSVQDNLNAMKPIFKRYNPEYPFEYNFLDEEYSAKFKDAETTGILVSLFAGLTIFISCLGLFGLATYMAESRVKEIGVRKVLGASVLSLTALLSRDFIALVLVAIVIASPIAWYAMDKWLISYTFHISINWWVFIIAGLLAIFISLATVSYQAVKAALANPVKSLRSE